MNLPICAFWRWLVLRITSSLFSSHILVPVAHKNQLQGTRAEGVAADCSSSKGSLPGNLTSGQVAQPTESKHLQRCAKSPTLGCQQSPTFPRSPSCPRALHQHPLRVAGKSNQRTKGTKSRIHWARRFASGGGLKAKSEIFANTWATAAQTQTERRSRACASWSALSPAPPAPFGRASAASGSAPRDQKPMAIA